MATKSYSKHKEYKEFSSSGNAPYTTEQFDMLKSELIPKGSKLETFGRGVGNGEGSREFHYEYKEEKHPTGKYDRKDLHTVEEYTIPAKTVPKASESKSYYYEKEERDLPAITSGVRTYNYETSTSSTPGYSKVKNTKMTKEMSHNVEELDSLLDDLQKDQERQLYKSGYTSDTAESSSFDYKRASTPVKSPSSGYSTLKRAEREERMETSSWTSSPLPPPSREIRQQLYREENTESRVTPAAPACTHCHHTLTNTGTLSRSSTPMNKVTTTVKTYTYSVPAGADPTSVPLPTQPDHTHTYLSTSDNTHSSTTVGVVPPSPSLGCQYCSHCNNTLRGYSREHYSSIDEKKSERMVYPAPANDTKLLSPNTEPINGHGPYGPSSYKFSETTYSAHSTTERPPARQQPPKQLDDLLADFPEARFPTSQPDGVVRRKVEMTHESVQDRSQKAPVTPSKNVSGPAVYYPPGHTPFAKKETAGYQASAMQGGGAYASGRGMYEYESGASSKEKHSEKKTAVPICLPLCCAMPCSIM